MKNIASKKNPKSNKAASLVQKSNVQKSIVKRKQAQNKQMKFKHPDANISIKEKLSGKIFSPTVEKAKNDKQKKVKKSPTKEIKPSPEKQKILPVSTKKQISKPKIEVKKEKTVLPVQKNNKNAEHNIVNEKEVISKIKKKHKVTAPEVEKTVTVNEDKVEVKDVTGTKRKLKSEKSKLQTKKLKSNKEGVKVESESSPVSLDVKTEDQNIVAKPRQAKVKRKSSVTSVKDLKPISNIKSLAKRPVKKISKAQIKKKLPNFQERGVCYFSRIPHGFYEKEMENYCSQFGEVTGVYHPVSKSGNSRGYAFVEFRHKEVAEVVAETMNNYLMFNRLLKCQYIPPESQRPWVFKQNRNNMKEAAMRRRENLQMQMRTLSKAEVQKWKKRRQRRVKSFHNKLAKLGVDYEFQVHDIKENIVQEEKKDEQ